MLVPLPSANQAQVSLEEALKAKEEEGPPFEGKWAGTMSPVKEEDPETEDEPVLDPELEAGMSVEEYLARRKEVLDY